MKDCDSYDHGMKWLAISLNVVAALLAIVGGIVYVKEHSLAINPVLLYFGLLGVPGIPGTVAILRGSAQLRTMSVIVHILTLVVLGMMFLLAWMLSPGSGFVATPFLVGMFLAGMLAYLLLSPNNSKAKIISLSLVVGGGVGNLIDRILNEGRVIDFMNIGVGSLRTGVFNVADIAISFGVVWFFAISFNASKCPRASHPHER